MCVIQVQNFPVNIHYRTLLKGFRLIISKRNIPQEDPSLKEFRLMFYKYYRFRLIRRSAYSPTSLLHAIIVKIAVSFVFQVPFRRNIYLIALLKPSQGVEWVASGI